MNSNVSEMCFPNVETHVTSDTCCGEGGGRNLVLNKLIIQSKLPNRNKFTRLAVQALAGCLLLIALTKGGCSIRKSSYLFVVEIFEI